MATLDTRLHLKAVQTQLASLGYPVEVGFAPNTGQYVVLTGPSWRSPDELALGPGDLGLDTEIRIKAVTGTVDGVAIMLRDIRALLTPGLVPARLPTAGWETWIRWQRSEFVDVDESTTITGTNRHPAFGVETYQLTSDPTS